MAGDAWGSHIYGQTRRLAQRVLQKNYYYARASYHRSLHQRSLQYKKPPLLIYQMGKVGSKTIRSTLQASTLDRSVYHVHLLSPDRIEKLETERREYLGTEKEHLLKHIWQYQHLRKQMADDSTSGRWKIVTLTREPISRNISAFFENLEVSLLDADHRYGIRSDYYGFDITLDGENIDELVRLFFERLYHDRPLVFFDEELKTVFGVDVFASDFPVSRGYKIYEGERADVLLVRLESLNRCARDAFKEFLGIEDFALVNANVGGDKAYSSLYERCKESIVLPQAYIDRMYDSKYMLHFYCDEEIAGFRAKWRVARA